MARPLALLLLASSAAQALKSPRAPLRLTRRGVGVSSLAAAAAAALQPAHAAITEESEWPLWRAL